MAARQGSRPRRDGQVDAKDVTLEAASSRPRSSRTSSTRRFVPRLPRRASGTKATKSRGMVAGGRSKPWRQKGTGRARAGTTRAPQWTGGGVAFAPAPRSFDLKVNRKARKAALRGALSSHAGQRHARRPRRLPRSARRRRRGRPPPSSRVGRSRCRSLVVAQPEEEAVAKSFRNLRRRARPRPVDRSRSARSSGRARSSLTEAALARLQETAR